MGLKEKEIRERGEELLKFFGLYEDKDKKVGNFFKRDAAKFINYNLITP